jgi:hypothetical protein
MAGKTARRIQKTHRRKTGVEVSAPRTQHPNYSMPRPLKNLLKKVLPAPLQNRIRKMLRPATPMEKVVKELKRRNLKPQELHALEVFGRDGHWHTQCYAGHAKTLEVWEIQEQYRDVLQKNFPGAKVKITDSFVEIRHTAGRYNFIVVDNSLGTFRDDPVPGGVATTYCEHFELFPNVFRVAMDSAILILNVIPETNEAARKKYAYLFNETQLARRRDFYQTDHPEKVSFDKMVETYKRLANDSGFKVEDFFFEKRGENGVAYYLVLKFARSAVRANGVH